AAPARNARADGGGWAGRAAPPPDAAGRRLPQLVRTAPGAHHLEPLGHADVARVCVADGIAELRSPGAEPVALLDLSVEQRRSCLPGEQQVVVPGLAQVAGDLCVLLQ